MSDHITLRNVKGEPLTYTEADRNFSSYFQSASVLGSDLVLHYPSTSLAPSGTFITVPIVPFPYTGSAIISGSLEVTGSTSFNGLVKQTGFGDSTFFGEGAGTSDDKTDNGNTAFGYNALTNTTSGIKNTAIGTEALTSNTTGYGNVAVGNKTLSSLVNGTGNIAFGQNAAVNLVSGNNNIVLGLDALSQGNVASENVSIGGDSLKLLNSGTENTAVGYNSGQNLISASQGNVVIGNNAGPSTPTQESNKLYISNTSGSPLIGGDFLNKEVNISASLHLSGGLYVTSSHVSFEALTGSFGRPLSSSGYILTYDTGSGAVSWFSTSSLAGFPFTGSARITGSLDTTGSVEFTGSFGVIGKTELSGALEVTSSFINFIDLSGSFGRPLSSSGYILAYDTGSGAVSWFSTSSLAGFPFTGSARITGSLDTTGSVEFTGSLDVDGDTKITGSVDVTGSMNVDGDTKITGSFSTTGSFINFVDLSGSFGRPVSSSGYLLTYDTGSGTVSWFSTSSLASFPYSGSARITGSLDTTGSVEFTGSFDVDGDTKITGSVDITGSLEVDGNTKLTGSLSTTGSFINFVGLSGSFGRPVSSSGYILSYDTGSGTVSWFSTSSLSGFPFTGSARITGSLDTTGSVKFTGSLDIDGDTKLTGSLSTTGSFINFVGLSGSFGRPVSSSGYVLAYDTGSGTVSWFSTSSLGSGFPYTGSARITGSLDTTGSVGFTGSLEVIGLTTLKGLVYQQNLGGSTYFGDRAGETDNGAGHYNTGIGQQALSNIDYGGENVAIGVTAGREITTGEGNVAVGGVTLLNLTTGNYNTALGNRALFTNTTGTRNIAIGQRALYDINPGNNNTAIGTEAGVLVTGNSSGNVFIGNQAGPISPETISNKLYISNEYGTPLIGGDFSTHQVEMSASLHVTGGLYVTSSDVYFRGLTGSFGNPFSSSGYILSYDTASGAISWFSTSSLSGFPYTGSARITGSLDTTGSVEFTGSLTVTGSANIAGKISVTGLGGSTLIGYKAGENDDLSFNYNTAIGHQALQNATVASNNTAIGPFSLNGLIEGERNTAIGLTSAAALTSGSRNISIGTRALNTLTGGSNNTAIGHEAGANANSDSSNNVFLGEKSGPSTSTTINDELYISNNVGTPLIGGNFSDSYVNINGDLGVSGALSVTSSFVNFVDLTGSFGRPLSSSGYILAYDTGSGAISWFSTSSLSGFPYTGSARITGSLDTTGSLEISGSVDVIGNTKLTGSLLTTGSFINFVDLSGSFGRPVSSSGYLLTYDTGSGTVSWFSTSSLAGFPFTGSARITGSLDTTGSVSFTGSLESVGITKITGSLSTTGSFINFVDLSGSFGRPVSSSGYLLTYDTGSGTVSWFSTSSLAGFPFTGSARITGSLDTTGSVSFTGSFEVVGNAEISGSITQGSGSSSVIELVKSMTVTSGSTDISPIITPDYYSGLDLLYTAKSSSVLTTGKVLGTFFNQSGSVTQYDNGHTFGNAEIDFFIRGTGTDYVLYAQTPGTYEIKYKLVIL